jgi:hypothetical protein
MSENKVFKTKPCPTYRNNPECAKTMKIMSNLCVSCRNLSDKDYNKEIKRRQHYPKKEYKERTRRYVISA